MKFINIVLIGLLSALIVLAGCRVQPGNGFGGKSSFAGKATGTPCDSDYDCGRGETCSRGICTNSAEERADNPEEEISTEEVSSREGYGGSPCTDSDGGKNFVEKGQVEVNGETKEDFCYTFKDEKTPYLFEAICGDQKFGNDQYYYVQKKCEEAFTSVAANTMKCVEGKCVKWDGCFTLSQADPSTKWYEQGTNYKLGNKVFEVLLWYTNDGVAKFIVNGEMTSLLKKGEGYTLKDESSIQLKDVVYQPSTNGIHKATACFLDTQFPAKNCPSGSECNEDYCIPEKQTPIYDSMIEGETKSYTLGDYDIKISNLKMESKENIPTAIFELTLYGVKPQKTPSLKQGESYTLSDGYQFFVDEILYQNYAGGVRSVGFFIVKPGTPKFVPCIK